VNFLICKEGAKRILASGSAGAGFQRGVEGLILGQTLKLNKCLNIADEGISGQAGTFQHRGARDDFRVTVNKRAVYPKVVLHASKCYLGDEQQEVHGGCHDKR
jgi:hypothetical protein